jgi:hypothetical protein
MESMTGFSKDNCERDIKFYRKMFKGQILWVMFNLSVTFFNGYALMHPPSAWSGSAFGAMAVTSIWSLMFLLESWEDLRSSKLKYNFFTELHDVQMASTERKHYEIARKNYEELTISLKEKQSD